MNIKESDIKLYNLIFPIWLLWLFPLTWIVIIPMNFIIDSLVIWITLKVMKLDRRTKIYKKCILKVWGFGFLADFIGTIFMFIPLMIDMKLDYNTPIGLWWYENMTNAVSYNPLESGWAMLWITLAVLISAVCIYSFNYKITFRKMELDDVYKKRIALVLAIITAPYLFYLPTIWFY